MSAPDRTAEVAATVKQHRELFGSDDSRRGILYFVCADLNVYDNGRWGILRKLDQDGFIPSDIIVDALTREYFDVLAGDPDRASWQPRGVLENPQWVWAPASLVKPADRKPPDEPPAPPAPPAPPEPTHPDVDVLTGRDVLAQLLAPFEAIAAAHTVMAHAALDISVELQRLRTEGVKVKT